MREKVYWFSFNNNWLVFIDYSQISLHSHFQLINWRKPRIHETYVWSWSLFKSLKRFADSLRGSYFNGLSHRSADDRRDLRQMLVSAEILREASHALHMHEAELLFSLSVSSYAAPLRFASQLASRPSAKLLRPTAIGHWLKSNSSGNQWGNQSLRSASAS